MNKKRRETLKGMLLATAGAGISARSVVSTHRESAINYIPKGGTILFQGDSITDAHRSKAHYYPNQEYGMGRGYVRYIVQHLMLHNPALDLQFYNRGISGHKVFQLRDRWEDDCLMLKPDVLSIMIGVNDFWHTLDWNYNGTAEVYENDLDDLMAWTKKELPNVKIIMGEPFVCHDGTAIKPELWKGEFEKYQVACKRVSEKYNTAFVPYQKVFDDALELAPTSYWCPDGVHPSMAGAALMAEAWLDVYSKLG